MITPTLVFLPFSCHGTHKITFTDHTACGQMQLTSQRERGLINPGPARDVKGSEDQFPVTPVFIHEITRHLRSLYYRWILYVLHKPNFKKSTLWLPYLIFPTILWFHQDVPTRSWSMIIFSLSFTSLTSSVFISNLEPMIYHHNHYSTFWPLSHSGKIPIPVKRLSMSTSHLQCTSEYGWNSTQNACYFFLSFHSWLSIFLASTSTDSSNCIWKIFRKKNSRGFPSSPMVKNLSCNTGDAGLNLGQGTRAHMTHLRSHMPQGRLKIECHK